MTEASDSDNDRIICFCHNVRRCEIVAAIRNGATTHERLQECTRASTGCGGCEYELLEILSEELAEAAAGGDTKPAKG